MAIDHSLVGKELFSREIRWTATDCMLYALAVGAGTEELEWVTENTEGTALRVLPMYFTMAGASAGGAFDPRAFGEYGLHQVVHGSHRLELHAPLEPEGRARESLRVAGIYDMRSGALVELESLGQDPDSGALLYVNTASLFVIGEGGFGGPRPPARRPLSPLERKPDFRITSATHAEQALLYRLCGDRNPIHSDPALAKMAGFERPILHGLCSFGFAGRALMRALCNGDPRRFRSMEARFARPVYPGDVLTTSIWVQGEEALFRTTGARGETVLDRGLFRFRPIAH